MRFRRGVWRGREREDHADLLSSNAGSWAEAEGLESFFVIRGEFGVAEPSLGNELIWAAEVFLRVRHDNTRNRDCGLMGTVLGIDEV